ncbi:MAG: hypothetical protein KAG66_10475, partial [Methylococcales bacterium]|nr:hypothetical protein [Methylococcales bacterium]
MLTQLFKPDKDYTLASALFLRVLALIYFAAFSSMAVQIIGLAGSEGILPLQPLLDYRLANEGVAAYWHMTHLFWLASSDLALKSVAIAGSVFSLLV